MKQIDIFKLKITYNGIRYELSLFNEDSTNLNKITFIFKQTLVSMQVGQEQELCFDARDYETGIELINETLKQFDFTLMHIDWHGMLEGRLEGLGVRN